MRSLVSNLQEKLEPVVVGLGFELLCLELQGTGNDAVLRIYIDSANGIGVAECASVSREVSALLDVEDPIDVAYRLEVSSPGFDRPLVKPEHFVAWQGREAKLRLRLPLKGQRNFKGRIVSFEAGLLNFDVDGELYSLPLADIERARLVPVFD
jgi:ribosome maturation factor RimP